MNPRDVECPRCGAARLTRCRSLGTGRPIGGYHSERQAAAEQQPAQTHPRTGNRVVCDTCGEAHP